MKQEIRLLTGAIVFLAVVAAVLLVLFIVLNLIILLIPLAILIAISLHLLKLFRKKKKKSWIDAEYKVKQ